MFKILLSLLIFCNVNTYVIAQSSGTENLDFSADDKSVLFENLIKKFNTTVETKSTAAALNYLNEAELLLSFFKDDQLKSAQTTLALAFAKADYKEKAKSYIQLAASKSRGKLNQLSLSNFNKLGLAYVFMGDEKGLDSFFDKNISDATKENKNPLKIAYVNSLLGVNGYAKASTLLSELYSNTPLSTSERAEILCLLIINSIKLNQTQFVTKYHSELELLKPDETPNYLLAKAMFLEHKSQYANAIKNYNKLFFSFNKGKRDLVYIDGMLQLAQLYSKQLKKDSANTLFKLVSNSLPKPLNATAIGINYLKLYQSHLRRFNETTPALNKIINTKDSLFNKELIAVTRELTYKHKIEEDKQKVELLNKNRALDAALIAKNKQRSLLIISCLGLIVLGSGAVIYFLYQRKKQSNLLHLAELERLKQLHKTEVIKKLSASQEAERWRIADQLHDEVGSMISVVRLNLSANPKKQETISEEKIATANRILVDVANTVREMSHELMPVAIRKYGLINSIEQLISDINTSGKIYIEHLIYGFDNLSKYPEDFQISFYRIVQELFQNIVKHSKATNAIFQLMEHADSINLYIEDNGKGIEIDKSKNTGKGIGLLANRIDYYEGKISIEGQPGKGTLIVIDIPTGHMNTES